MSLFLTDEQANKLSATWKVLIDCAAELPIAAFAVWRYAKAIWKMAKMETATIEASPDLADKVKAYGMQAHEILQTVADSAEKLKDLYVEISVEIQQAKHPIRNR